MFDPVTFKRTEVTATFKRMEVMTTLEPYGVYKTLDLWSNPQIYFRNVCRGREQMVYSRLCVWFHILLLCTLDLSPNNVLPNIICQTLLHDDQTEHGDTRTDDTPSDRFTMPFTSTTAGR